MLIHTAAVALLGAVMTNANTGEPPAGVTLHEITADGVTMDYAVYRSPHLEPGQPAPALVFLHGYGECGTDGQRHLNVGLMPAVNWESARWPFVIVMPQKPEFNTEWEDFEPQVLAALDAAIEAQNIDPERIAITGLSQGGHGTIAFASRHPDRFAAAAPVCGYTERRFSERGERLGDEGAGEDDDAVTEAAEALAGTPVWLFHGGLDDVVPPSESRALHAALEARGADVRLTVYEDKNHNSWDAAYGIGELAEWLRARLGVED